MRGFRRLPIGCNCQNTRWLKCFLALVLMRLKHMTAPCFPSSSSLSLAGYRLLRGLAKRGSRLSRTLLDYRPNQYRCCTETS
jgi:hypothetical protein